VWKSKYRLTKWVWKCRDDCCCALWPWYSCVTAGGWTMAWLLLHRVSYPERRYIVSMPGVSRAVEGFHESDGALAFLQWAGLCGSGSPAIRIVTMIRTTASGKLWAIAVVGEHTLTKPLPHPTPSDCLHPHLVPTTSPHHAPTTPPHHAPTTPPHHAPTTPPHLAPTILPSPFFFSLVRNCSWRWLTGLQRMDLRMWDMNLST